MMLQVTNLSFAYDNSLILNDLNIDIKKDKLTALLGANGSGKSTFFKCCMNFLKPKNGTIHINGIESSNKSPHWIAKNVSFVPQQTNIAFGFSVFEIVLMGRSVHKKFKFTKEDIHIAENALEIAQISHLKNKSITELSGGEKQLVLLSRAIAQECPLMILDEPTSALDFKNQILFWEIVNKISKNKTTVIVCTHEPNHALWFCNDFIALKKGKILDSGEIKNLKEETLYKIYGKECKLIKEKPLDFIVPVLK